MKRILNYICFTLLAFTARSQYYFRGEITDDKNHPLQNVRIQVYSTHAIYYSGSRGNFLCYSSNKVDSLTFLLDGYELKTIKAVSDTWISVVLKVLPAGYNKNKPKLISITKDHSFKNKFSGTIDNETYFQLVENETVNAVEYPNTGFSLNVNKASYSNIRRFLNARSPVPPDAIRIEELLNYFNLNYHEPDSGKTFQISSQLTDCPWSKDKQMLYVSVNAKKLALNNIPPGNFVFLIDVSGSMDMPNRLPLLQAAFQLFVKNLRAVDTVSIVTYGGGVGIWLPPTGGAEKEKILGAIEELTAQGDTPGEAGIITAYKLAKSVFIKGGNNRVILATDGDFNVGQTSERALEELIIKMRQTGVYLTCLGVGMGNFKDSKLEVLAKKGNGNFAYLDNLQEAEKVLVKELTQNFYTVANDVFMNIEFNPKCVNAYRLIGFDNKRDAIAENITDMEGGEIGSANSALAIFEVALNPELARVVVDDDVQVAAISLRYSTHEDTTQKIIRYNCIKNYRSFAQIDKQLQFAAALTMFGLKLKQSPYIKNTTWSDIEAIAKEAIDENNFLQNEFLQLLEKAKKIYPDKRRKGIF